MSWQSCAIHPLLPQRQIDKSNRSRDAATVAREVPHTHSSEHLTGQADQEGVYQEGHAFAGEADDADGGHSQLDSASSVSLSFFICSPLFNPFLAALYCSEWTEDGQLWIQYVSSTPATRLDVINLQETLDTQLQSRQARETGICPVREEVRAMRKRGLCGFVNLYSPRSCTRSASTNSFAKSPSTAPVSTCCRLIFIEFVHSFALIERGLLLLRVRDEARMTLSAYETLYESSIAYGVRKALVAEQKKMDLDAKIRTLQVGYDTLFSSIM